MDDSSGNVKVACKICKNKVAAGLFVLDPVHKIMVCPNCAKETSRKLAKPKEQAKAAIEPPKTQKPAGWDSDDEYLEKAFKQKQQSFAPIQKIDDRRVKYTCRRCKYVFTIDTFKMHPDKCPYCTEHIAKFQM